jgi:SsrA-binding protein
MTAQITNRKARHDYEILERFNAGLELSGTEVKSIRAGHISLIGSYITIRGGEAYLLNANIKPFQPKNAPSNYDPKRARRILLSKREIEELAKAESTAGLTIVPISVYNKGRFLKLDLAIARGKKKFDKRQAIKKRDTERDLKRTLK